MAVVVNLLIEAKPVQCPLCQDRGLLLVESGAIPCRCTQEKQKIRQRLSAGLAPEMWNCRFEFFCLDFYSRQLSYPDKSLTYYEGARQALQSAQNFVKEFKKNGQATGLMLVGQVGSGKTFLAAAICNELIDAEMEVMFMVVPDFLDELRAWFSKSNKGFKENMAETLEKEPPMEKARRVPLLVLDDLGAHNYTDWTRNTIYSLLNYRMNYRLPLIITTNLSLQELDNYLGERTTSRIIQLCRPCRLMVDKDIRHLKHREREARYQEENMDE